MDDADADAAAVINLALIILYTPDTAVRIIAEGVVYVVISK